MHLQGARVVSVGTECDTCVERAVWDAVKAEDGRGVISYLDTVTSERFNDVPLAEGMVNSAQENAGSFGCGFPSSANFDVFGGNWPEERPIGFQESIVRLQALVCRTQKGALFGSGKHSHCSSPRGLDEGTC